MDESMGLVGYRTPEQKQAEVDRLKENLTEDRNRYNRVTKYLNHTDRMKNDPDYRARVTEYNRRYRLMTVYGITLEEFNEMLEGQNGVCAICLQVERDNRNLSVDHNHATGEIRGLLCSRCNTSIGRFEEDREMLLRAVDYLLKYAPPETN